MPRALDGRKRLLQTLAAHSAGRFPVNEFLLRYRFRLLLLGSVLLCLVLGWPEPPLWLKWGALLGLLLAGINTLRRKLLLRRLALLIGLFNLALLGLGQLVALPRAMGDGLGSIALYILLGATLFRRVTSERPVTGELVYGLCALYLQIALAFAFAYQLVSALEPGALRGPAGPLMLDDFVYYSLATLTTVGYGDIHAIAPAARLLAGTEAVVGVMFIALAVARCVALMQDENSSGEDV